MAMTSLYGKGFTAEVPEYLDDAYKSAAHAVFKGKAAAERYADREALWAAGGVAEVEGVVAAQIEGHEGLWFGIWIYTDEQAEKTARAAALRRSRGFAS